MRLKFLGRAPTGTDDVEGGRSNMGRASTCLHISNFWTTTTQLDSLLESRQMKLLMRTLNVADFGARETHYFRSRGVVSPFVPQAAGEENAALEARIAALEAVLAKKKG